MNLRTLFVFAAAVTLAFGLGFMFAPGPLTELYGVSLDPGGLYVAQLFGAALIGLAIIAWTARTAEKSSLLEAILMGFFIFDLFGFLFSLWALMGNVVNDLGISSVILYGLFTIGFGYFRFAKSDNAEEPAPDTE